MTGQSARERAWRQARTDRPAALAGGGGSSGGMDRGQVADMIAASEARFETRLADMGGKLDRLIDRMEAIDAKVSEGKAENQRTRSTVRTTAIALGGALLTGMALIVAVANVSFGFGTRVAETARTEAAQVYQQRDTRGAAAANVPRLPPAGTGDVQKAR